MKRKLASVYCTFVPRWALFDIGLWEETSLSKFSCEMRTFASGLVCLHTSETGTFDMKEALRAENESGQFGFALVYFCKVQWVPADILNIMSGIGCELPFAACSTAGEITPLGLEDGQNIVLLFPKDHFNFQAHYLNTRKDGGIETISTRVSLLKQEFTRGRRSGDSAFALCLLDGASFMEEAITAAVHWGLEELPLLGGSAGDNLNFGETTLILDGNVIDDGAILLFVTTDLPMEVFKTENFVPSLEKLVVTRSDPDRRVVHEFNAAPAAIVYAEAIGTDPNSLTPQSFASHPLVMRVGGEYYCRSIQKVNEDNSLSFFRAVDDGIVLTVAEQTGMARTTQKVLGEVSDRLGGLDFILGFDCVLRKLDARNRQITRKISAIYQDHNVVGFNTYGEQYRSMHLNQTLTGVAFGQAGGKHHDVA